MCGISGYVGKHPLDPSRIQQTLSLMKNRGPDNQGHTAFNDRGQWVVLLHSRLSIIDLDPRSNQPFSIGKNSLVFNGEIYNYFELREALKCQNISFRTQSDTEVLLQSYIAKGMNCVSDFEGMWSFAIYDKENGILVLSRDRFGEKPLYTLETEEGFFFGSEIKFIRALSGQPLSVNYNQLLRYLILGYRSLYKKREETFFLGVREVPPATNIIFSLNNFQSTASRYWAPRWQPNQSLKIADAIDGLRNRLIESIKLRLRADVPIAFCLSGGVDSAALVSIAAKQLKYNVTAFSIIDRDERYDESKNIQATIEDVQCRHVAVETSRKDFFNRLRGLIDYHDGPLATISYYVHSFLSEAISKEAYRVVASGTGADELLTGYYDHYLWHLVELRNHPDYPQRYQEWQNWIKPLIRNPYLREPEKFLNQPDFRNHLFLNSNQFRDLLKVDFEETFGETKYCDSILRNRMLNELFEEVVPPILHEDDLNSMQYSIENRSPYLDSRLFEFSYTIPNEFLIREGYGKYILRRAMKGILNEQVRTDHQKRGFNASLSSLIDLENDEVRDFLLEGKIFEIVEKEKMERFLNALKPPIPNSASKFLFNFINAKLFLETICQPSLKA